MRFLDTNILLYAVGLHPEDAAKQRIAESVLMESENALSAQVMAEFYWQATHSKRSSPLTAGQARDFVAALTRFPVADVTTEVVMSGIAISRRYEIEYWDAALIAAAQSLGCAELYTEDLNAGQDYGGVRAVNPFA